MNKIVSINSKKFLGTYPYMNGSDLEEKFLTLGSVMSLAALPTVSLTYGGAIPFIILALILLTGAAIGAVAYSRRNPRQGLRFVAAEAVPKTPPTAVAQTKKAA